MIKSILDARTSKKNYILSGDQKYILEVESIAEDIIKDTQNILEKLKEEDHNKVNEIIEAVNSYNNAFINHTKSNGDRSVLEREVVKAGKDVEDKLRNLYRTQNEEMYQRISKI
ncbi:hypothetical protein U472_08610 [Orenia metallireducens]|uniref:Uncharacterized protein n=1 Tax=Orenia metallireducens TaxID=1413210 RepID=A0A1C0A754_9FIRM|nr:hypothetical protein U472_08610 [Orenia metallireducens]